jgi:putative ABC transport system permease protein
MIKNTLKIAWRSLMKNKVFSFINVFGLSVGLASCMFIGLYIHDELTFDRHHKNVGSLYQVNTEFIRSGDNKITPATPGGLAEALHQEFPEIVNTVRLSSLFVDDKTAIKYNSNGAIKSFYETKGYLADAPFFSFFNYDFVEGDAQTALSQPNSIVIEEEIATKIFGNQPALNKVLRIESNTNGSGDYTVTGVFKKPQRPTHIDARFFMPVVGGNIGQYLKSQTSLAWNNFFFTYIQLQAGSSPDQLTAKFPAFVEKYMRDDLKKAGFGKRQFLTAVQDIHLDPEVGDNVTAGGSWTYLYVLISIALFILLIACINFMNLSTARSSKRSDEVGVRKALGAARSSLIRQFLSESMLLSLLALGLAFGWLGALMPAFESVSGKHFHLTNTQYTGFLALFLGLAIGTGLLAGTYPAFYLSSFQPIKVLKGHFANSLAVLHLRRGLVVFQFAISVALIVASVVIGYQMQYMRSKDLGFAKDQQIIVPLRSEAAQAGYTALKNALGNNSQIESVGASAYYPGIFNPEDANFYKSGQRAEDARRTAVNRVDADYLKTLDIKTVAGRGFGPEHPGDSSNLIVLNEQAVREIGFANPEAAIGEKVLAQRQTEVVALEVIGVVRDFHFEDLKMPIKPFGFTLNENTAFNYLIVHAKGRDLAPALSAIETAWRQVNPNEAFDPSFLDDDFQKNYQAEYRLTAIIRYFTLIAILISCLGLFGLTSFSAEQRTKEIGIRKVLGASVAGITGLLARDFLKLVLIAIVIASPIAYYVMQKWLSDFAYRIDLQWWMFAGAGAVAVLIAFLTVGFQSVKAALANPVNALKN